uniref:C2H2-type domain-containing protein n=1 Tax=Ditylenchus dipsaci TaxID=166011 RepID=A0A915DVN8_9BILA
MFMNSTTSNELHHQEDVFFGDDGQEAVGEYLVVVEEADEHHPYPSTVVSSAVDQWDEEEYLESTASTVNSAVLPTTHLDMDFVDKNSTRILVEHVRDQHNNHGMKRKYCMKNRPSASYYKCKMCSVVVKHPSKIVEHMRVHTGDRPFPCPHCSLTFTQAGALMAHLRIHNGQRCVHQKSCHMAPGSGRNVEEAISNRKISIRRQRKLEDDRKLEPQYTIVIQKSVQDKIQAETQQVHTSMQRLPEIPFDDINFNEPPTIHMETHVQCSENVDESTDTEEISDTYMERNDSRRRQLPNPFLTARSHTRKRNANSSKALLFP